MDQVINQLTNQRQVAGLPLKKQQARSLLFAHQGHAHQGHAHQGHAHQGQG